MYGFDHGDALRFIDAGGICSEDVPFEREGARATTAAQLPVLAGTAFPSQRALAQCPKQRRRLPDLGEALGAQIAGDLGEIGTRRQFAVRRDTAVLVTEGTACLVIE